MVAINNNCKTQCFCNFWSPGSSPEPLQNLSKIEILKSWVCVYIYIYIAFGSNPPASDKVKTRLPSPLLHLSSEDSFRMKIQRPSPGRRFPSSADPRGVLECLILTENRMWNVSELSRLKLSAGNVCGEKAWTPSGQEIVDFYTRSEPVFFCTGGGGGRRGGGFVPLRTSTPKRIKNPLQNRIGFSRLKDLQNWSKIDPKSIKCGSEKRSCVAYRFRIDFASIWERFLMDCWLQNHEKSTYESMLLSYLNFEKFDRTKKVPRRYMWHVQSFISIRFLQCFWTIRSLRTCVNFSIRALVHYLNLQLKHLSKNVPKWISETITIFTPLSIDLFIDFGSQNPSKTTPKSIKNHYKILSRNMFEK